MKNSNFIADSVFKVNLKYVRMQNKTKELFFRCLDEGRSYEYFKKKLKVIWNNTQYDFMDKELSKYQELIHERNVGKTTKLTNEKYFDFGSKYEISKEEEKFQLQKEKEYRNSQKSSAYKNNKDEYLKNKVNKYNNQVVPYYFKATNTLARYVQLSTYASMVHNTNLTRAGWNTTLNDADEVGQTEFWIPYHPFSCIHCLEHQNKILTKEEILDIVGIANEAEGDILHPNCKCEITFYMADTVFNKPKYSDAELQEQYAIRQKVNSLTLRKEEILSDIKTQKNLGNYDEVDKLNQKRNKINKEIKELKEALPTESLKKQVVAINR